MPRSPACPESCNVLLLGGGGREHALAWKLAQSPRLHRLWISDTANAGLRQIAEPCPVAMDLKNVFRMRRWCEQEQIHLVVVGPEGLLAAGITDALATPSCRIFGPTRDGARLEADKAFAKKLMRQAAVPTAEAREFHDAEAAMEYARTREDGCVVKATGLASGKGAFVCPAVDEAVAAIERVMVQREFGAAGDHVLIEAERVMIGS